MNKTCIQCKNQYDVTPDDLSFYEKMGVPAPNLCPDCRFRRRAAFRNEFSLYNRKCDLCGQAIVSMYNPRAPYTVYCPDCWHSDKWEPFSFGKEYDRNKPFFEQLGELLRSVPKIAIYRSDVVRSLNSPYENFAGGNKDCYLVANSGPGNENCGYSRGMIKCRDTFDAYYVDESERLYEGVGVHNSTGVRWAQNAVECLDSSFLINCSGVQNCFGCVNLRHKGYHFLNEPLEKSDYETRVGKILGSYRAVENFRKQFEDFSLKFPRRATSNLKNVNVDGDYIFESKNCHASFELSYCENVSYSYFIKKARDVYDILGHGRDTELMLEAVGAGYSTRVIAGWWVENVEDVEYCLSTRKSKRCFGCDGVKNAKYTILNKQYDEAEYDKIRSYIMEELKEKELYGLFFPPELAFFGYNETVGQDNLPITKEEALRQGFKWQDDLQMTTGKETLKPEQIPDHIKDVIENILKEILACISCGRNYRITKQEFDFYKRMNIPVPRKCFYCRHADRLRRRGPFKLYARNCAKCGKGIQTTYAPEKPEIVYCEACYQKEVI